MKKALLILGIAVLLGVTMVLFIMNDIQKTGDQVPADEATDITETFPTKAVTVDIPNTPTVALKNEFGPAVQVQNFLKKPDVVPDMQNQGVFFLGNTFASNEAEKELPYVITFAQETTFFNITLLAEPLGKSRLEAEAYLRNQLETTDTDLCALGYTVSAPEYVSDEFAGKDLRFSFCSGNTALPME